MDTRTRRQTPLGEFVAGLGAVVLLASLWQPWYRLTFPDELLSQAQSMAPRMGEMGGFVTQGIDQLRSAGDLPVTAWQAFDQADMLLAGAAAVALGLVVLNAIGALATRLDNVIVLAGAVALATVAYRLASPPGSNSPLAADLLHPATALYAGLLGAALMLAGGLMALGTPTAPAATPQSPGTDVRIWSAS
jgi:hypothetical protein